MTHLLLKGQDLFLQVSPSSRSPPGKELLARGEAAPSAIPLTSFNHEDLIMPSPGMHFKPLWSSSCACSKSNHQAYIVIKFIYLHYFYYTSQPYPTISTPPLNLIRRASKELKQSNKTWLCPFSQSWCWRTSRSPFDNGIVFQEITRPVGWEWWRQQPILSCIYVVLSLTPAPHQLCFIFEKL